MEPASQLPQGPDSQAYRDTLELLLHLTQGRLLLNVEEVCRLTGLSRKTVKKHYPFDGGNRIAVPQLARLLTQ
ncbi:MAG: hypothetical protein KH009_08890 [Clostridiales bacterium]|nr:hypothetical protein [Clostridiales bacterium]